MLALVSITIKRYRRIKKIHSKNLLTNGKYINAYLYIGIQSLNNQNTICINVLLQSLWSEKQHTKGSHSKLISTQVLIVDTQPADI